ncbi:MAG TPA: patatin-like phospholipase family protein [Solirubrobacteraceae bacterium]|nr:patatin-like phospholipase family protein [Solirubrobacteraceae bacterium]
MDRRRPILIVLNSDRTPGNRVSLVLGEGGARGYAHIGAIEALHERGYEIVAVTGSSMGALVGGIYAVGQLDAFAEWVMTLSQRDVLRLMDVSLARSGVMRAERVLARVRELVGDQLIEDLRVPFTAVATDLLARREVWFQRGPLDVAIRASIAMPGIFTPVRLNGRLLVDGGLLQPVPVAPAAAIQADLTVAVSLGGERGGIGPAVQETADPGHLDQWVSRFRRGASQAFSATGAGEGRAGESEDPPNDLPAGITPMDVMIYALEAMQGVVSRYCLAGYPPDILITVPKDACRTLDYHRAPLMVELGRRLTADALGEFEAARTPEPERE